MDLNQLMEAVTIGDAVGLIAALGAVYASIKWLRPALKAITNFLDDWNGEAARPGVQARPGVVAQLGELRTETAELRESVGLAQTLARDAALSAADAALHSKPDHGQSSYDHLVQKIDGINRAIDDSIKDRAELHQHQAEQSEQLRAIAAHIGLTTKEDS